VRRAWMVAGAAVTGAAAGYAVYRLHKESPGYAEGVTSSVTGGVLRGLAALGLGGSAAAAEGGSAPH